MADRNITAEDFRSIALRLPGAEERAHMNHPDFRVNGRIFATLSYPDENWGMVKLSPELQNDFIHLQPNAFVPVKGAWGRQGCTSIRLAAVDATALEQALRFAWSKATAESSKTGTAGARRKRR